MPNFLCPRRTFSTLFLRLDDITAQVNVGASAVRVLQDNQTRTEETVGHLAADLSSMAVETAARAIRAAPSDGYTSSDGFVEGHIHDILPEPPPAKDGLHHHSAYNRGLEAAILVSATVGHDRCRQGCPCQCHVHWRFTTPNFLRTFIGIWMLTFINLVIPSTRQCDYHECHKNKIGSFTLSYYFPTWVLARVFTLICTWKDLSGPGVSVVVRMPRVRPEDAPLFRFIEIGDEDAIKALLSKREASPFDVTPEGKTCLWVSIFHNSRHYSHAATANSTFITG